MVYFIAILRSIKNAVIIIIPKAITKAINSLFFRNNMAAMIIATVNSRSKMLMVVL